MHFDPVREGLAKVLQGGVSCQGLALRLASLYIFEFDR